MFVSTRVFPALVLGLTLYTDATQAATLIWNGGGADDNWNTAANWTGVAFTTGDLPQFGGNTRLTPVNNLAADTLVGSIDFTNNTFANTTAFTLSGSRITLGGNISTVAVTGGAFNANITDQINLDLLLNATRTITVQNNGDKTHNLTINGVISDGGGGFGLSVTGGARLTLAGANTYTGVTTLGGTAVVVLSHANALPGGTATTGGTSALTIAGGILGLGAADFTRGLGTGVDQVQWMGSGGFAAFGANRIVNIGGAGSPMTMTWNSGGFVPTGGALLFGYGNGSDTQDATHTVDFQNPIDLNGAGRTITVNDGNGTTGALIDAVLSGGIINGTGTGSLTKNGGGTLSLTAASNYTGQTIVSSGVLALNHVNALPGGVGTTGGTSNLRISGNGIVGLGTGDFTRSLGTGVDQVQWTGAGGFAAFNADRVVNLGGAGATVTWATGSFVPNGSIFFLGANSETHTVDFQNPIDLNGATRTVEVNEATAVALDAIISGAISGSGGLTKQGDGTLALTSTGSTYTGQTYLATNTTRVTKLANFGQPSSLGAGTVGVPITMSTQFRSGTLNYVGTGDSSDRTFAFGMTTATFTNGGIIQNNGTGALTFTATNFNDAIAGITVARTLTLGGANTDLNTISGIIQNTNGITGVLNVTKADAGTWVLAGANTYSGTTTVSAGALHLNNASAIGTGPMTLSTSSTIDNSSGVPITLSTANVTTIGGNFTFGGTNDLSLANGTTIAAGNRTITLGGTSKTLTLGTLSLTNTAGTTTITANDAGSGNKLVLGGLILADANQARSQTINGSAAVEITGAVTDGTGTGADSLAYTGTSSLTLNGSNTYTGTTTMNNAAGTLTLAGSNTTSAVTLTTGRLNVNHAAAIGSGTLTLTAGTIDNTSGSAIIVSTANAVVLGGNLTFGGSNHLSFANGTATTAASRVITLNGTSKTLTFGPLSFTGTTTLTATDGGTGNKLTLGGLVLSESNIARTQTLTGTAAIEVSGAVADGTGTGADAITYTGSNTLTFTAANSYTGTTTVNGAGGTLRVNAASNISTGALVVTQGTLELNNAAQTVSTMTLGGTGVAVPSVITLATGTVLTQSGTLTYSSNATLQAATISDGGINLGGNARTWTVGDSASVDADLTVSSVISNTTPGTWTKNGAGRLVLSGANTFADIFAITDGVVRVSNANALGTTAGGTTVSSGRALELDGVSIGAEALSLNGTGVSLGGALRNLTGDNTYGGAITLAGGARINSDSGTLTLSSGTAIGGSAALTLGGSGNIVLQDGYQPTTAAVALTKDGTGTATINGATSHTSGTTINAGTLRLGASERLVDASGVTVASGTFDLNNFTETIASLTLGGLAGTATVTTGTGTLNLTGVTYSATNNPNGASISGKIDLGTTTRTFAVNDSTNATDDLTVSAAISSGAGGALLKTGVGVLVLSSANTYAGATSVRGGTLRVTVDNALPSGTALAIQNRDSATPMAIDIAGTTQTVGTVTLTEASSGTNQVLTGAQTQITDSVGTGVVKLTSSVNYNAGPVGEMHGPSVISAKVDLNGATRSFTINDSDQTTEEVTVSGTISNSGAAAGVTKTAAGTLVFTAANTYDGTTTVSGGVLRAGNSSAFGTTGNVSLNGTDAVLELANGVTINRPTDIADAGNNKTIRLLDGAAAATHSGNISITETTAGNFDVSSGSGGALTLSGVLSGTGAAGLSKEGVGTVTLAGANTYTGATAVNAGTLQVGNNGTGQTGSGAVVVSSGAAVQGSGTVRGQTFTLSAGATLRAGDSAAASSHASLTFAPGTASGTTHDLQGSLVLDITTAALVDSTLGGFVIGSSNYNGWVDSVSGTGAHDRLVFNNPDSGTGYNLNFLTTTGSLQVIGSGFTAQMGQVFNLLDWSGLVSPNFTGFTFSGGLLIGNGDEGADLDLPDLTGTGLLWDFSRFTSSGNVVVVPEPGRAALLLLGLGAALMRRRSKH